MKCLNKVLGEDCQKFCFVYVDDGIIFSQNYDEQCKHLDKLFQRLIQFNMTLKLSKCQFFQKSVQFLGHIISDEGITPPDEKLKAIKLFPSPKSRKELLSFIGFTQYYRSYNPLQATYTSKFKRQLSSKNKWIWTDQDESNFIEFKNSFLNQILS